MKSLLKIFICAAFAVGANEPHAANAQRNSFNMSKEECQIKVRALRNKVGPGKNFSMMRGDHDRGSRAGQGVGGSEDRPKFLRLCTERYGRL